MNQWSKKYNKLNKTFKAGCVVVFFSFIRRGLNMIKLNYVINSIIKHKLLIIVTSS